MSYHRIRSTAAARAYSEAVDLARRNSQNATTPQLEISRAWLDDYMARPIKTAFDWSPRLTVKPPGETR